MYHKLASQIREIDMQSTDILQQLKNVFRNHLLYIDPTGTIWPRDVGEKDSLALKKIISKESLAYKAIDKDTIFSKDEDVFNKVKSFAQYLKKGKVIIEVDPISLRNNKFPLAMLNSENKDIYLSASLFSENVLMADDGMLNDLVTIKSIDVDGVQHSFLCIKSDSKVDQILVRLVKISERKHRYFALAVLRSLGESYQHGLKEKPGNQKIISLLTASKIFERVDSEIAMIDWILNTVSNFNNKYDVNVQLRFVVSSKDDEISYANYLKGYANNKYLKKYEIVLKETSRNYEQDKLYLSLAPENVIFSSQALSLRNVLLLSFAADGIDNHGLDQVDYAPDTKMEVGLPLEVDEHRKRHGGKNQFKVISLHKGLPKTALINKGVIDIDQAWGYASLHSSVDLYKVPNDLTLLYYRYLLPHSVNAPQGLNYGKLYISNKYIADEADLGAMFAGRIYIGAQSKVVIEAPVKIDGNLSVVERTPILEIISHSEHNPAFYIGENTEVYTQPGKITEVLILKGGYEEVNFRQTRVLRRDEDGMFLGEDMVSKKVILVSHVVDRKTTYAEVFDTNTKEALENFLDKGDIVVVDNSDKTRNLRIDLFKELSPKVTDQNCHGFSSIDAFKAEYSQARRDQRIVRDVSLLILDNDFTNDDEEPRLVKSKKAPADKRLKQKAVNDHEGIDSVPEIRTQFPQSAIILNTERQISDDSLRQLSEKGDFEIFISIKGRAADGGSLAENDSFEWLLSDIISARDWMYRRLLKR